MAAQQNKQIMYLVDDEPIQNEMLKDYLSERFEYEIKTFDNGEDAINNIAENPEIIVLDFHLNSNTRDAQNGVEVLKTIKEIKPNANVIMLSGQDKIEVAVDSMKFGAYDYVIKGETAFARIENIINNITELKNIKEANKTYKNIIIFLSIVILTIILLSILMLKKLGG